MDFCQWWVKCCKKCTSMVSGLISLLWEFKFSLPDCRTAYLSMYVVVQFLIVDSVSLVCNRNIPTEASLFYLSSTRCMCVACESWRCVPSRSLFFTHLALIRLSKMTSAWCLQTLNSGIIYMHKFYSKCILFVYYTIYNNSSSWLMIGLAILKQSFQCYYF